VQAAAVQVVQAEIQFCITSEVMAVTELLVQLRELQLIMAVAVAEVLTQMTISIVGYAHQEILFMMHEFRITTITATEQIHLWTLKVAVTAVQAAAVTEALGDTQVELAGSMRMRLLVRQTLAAVAAELTPKTLTQAQVDRDS
jgi:membrane protein YqaA with SNARE-associated domain